MSLTVTTGGNPSFSTARKKVGTKSLLLNSSNPDYLLIDSQHNALFSSLNDFTVEYWYYDDTYTINFPISSSGFEIESNFIVNDRLIVRINGTDVYKFSIGSSDWNPTVWQHFAFVRSNNTVAAYINGNIQTNLTSSTYSQSANLSDLVIGAKDFGQSGFQNGWGGNLDELRISNVARYTSNFTPSTSEFSVDSSTLLLMHMEDLSASAYNGPAENVVPYYISTGTMSVYPPPKNVGGDFNSDLFWTADGDKANFPTLQGTLTCPNGLKFGDGTFQNSASTGSSLTVEEQTGTTQVTNVDTIIVTDGTLTQGANAGEAILNISGGAGGSISVSDGTNPTVTGISTLEIPDSTITTSGGLASVKLKNLTSDGNIVLDMSSSVAGSARIYSSASQRGSLFLYTNDSSVSPNTYAGFKAPPASGSSSYAMVLPSTQGGNNQVMKNDGSGNLSWSDFVADTPTLADIGNASSSTNSNIFGTDMIINGNLDMGNSTRIFRTNNIENKNASADILIDLKLGGALVVDGSSTQRGTLRLKQGTSQNDYVGLRCPSGTITSYDIILPPDVGTAGYVLSTDGSTGQTSWVAQSGGGGGSSLTVQDGVNTISNASTIEFPTGMLTTNSGSTATLQAPTLDQVLNVNASSSYSGTVNLNSATISTQNLQALNIKPSVSTLTFTDSASNPITAIGDNTNIFFGKDALSAVANADQNNTAYGYSALRQAFNGTDNVAVGYLSLEDVQNTDYNTAIGTSAGKSHNGSSNTFVGYNAGNSGGGTIYTYSNSTAIGANSVITKSNEIVLGTSSEEVSIPGGIALTETLPTATLSGTDLTLATQGLTYETFNYPHGAGAAAVTISEITLGSTNRVNAQYVVSVENGSSNDITFPTTINCQIGSGSAFAFKKNYTADVVIPGGGYGILTIFFKSSTIVFLSASAFA